MRDQEQIEAEVKRLLCEALDQRLAEADLRRPHLCYHNYAHRLDIRATVEGEKNSSYNRISTEHGQVIRLCLLGSDVPDEWGGDICDEEEDAKRCPDFDPIRTRRTIRHDFEEKVNDIRWLEANFPKVAVLLWVLEEVRAPELPWWKKLWFRFRRIKVEREMLNPGPSKLLPAHDEK